MSWRSTMKITRNNAIKEIMAALLCASDETLENVLLDLVDGDENHELYFYNFNIVDQYDEQDTSISYRNR